MNRQATFSSFLQEQSEKIIFFGSYAIGNPGEDSDIGSGFTGLLDFQDKGSTILL